MRLGGGIDACLLVLLLADLVDDHDERGGHVLGRGMPAGMPGKPGGPRRAARRAAVRGAVGRRARRASAGAVRVRPPGPEQGAGFVQRGSAAGSG